MTASSRSASAKTMFGLLPPSSSETRLIVFAATSAMRRPGGGLAGEGDLVDAGMGGHRLADLLARAGQDVDHAGRDAGLERQLAEPDRGERGGRCRLEDERIAGRQRGGHLPGGHHQRVVPRDDRADHADRLAQRVGHDRRVDDVGAPVEVLRRPREQLQRRDRDLDLGGALPLRLAVVAALELGQLIGPLVEQLRQPVEHARPLGRARLRPRALEAARAAVTAASTSSVPRLGDRGELAAVGRVEGRERGAGSRVAELAVDEELRWGRRSSANGSRWGHPVICAPVEQTTVADRRGKVDLGDDHLRLIRAGARVRIVVHGADDRHRNRIRRLEQLDPAEDVAARPSGQAEADAQAAVRDLLDAVDREGPLLHAADLRRHRRRVEPSALQPWRADPPAMRSRQGAAAPRGRPWRHCGHHGRSATPCPGAPSTGQWQVHAEGGAGRAGRLHVDRAAVGGDQLARDGQADSAPGVRPRDRSAR